MSFLKLWIPVQEQGKSAVVWLDQAALAEHSQALRISFRYDALKLSKSHQAATNVGSYPQSVFHFA
jgi:hypothetical protein